MSKAEIRNAATVILVRDPDTRPRVLMGQRGANAAFMPSRFVFPGGALDPGDREVPLAAPLDPGCAARLAEDAPDWMPHALAVAAVRELWEETGMILGSPGDWPGQVPADWTDFAATGHLPSPTGLSFVFRALTPPGRPRRFDARFFLADAAHLRGDPDDFDRASDELSHLQWIPLDEVRAFHMPFITEVVLAEVAAALPRLDAPESVPFFRNGDEESLFLRLGGSPLDQLQR